MTHITRTFTPRGSKITCEKCGLPICEVVVDDAYVGGYAGQWSKIFGNWRVPEPAVSQALNSIVCPYCGGRWIKDPLYAKGEFLHFENYGWWPGSKIVHLPKPRVIPPALEVKRPWWRLILNKLGYVS